jgi:hypothetical protein
MKTPNLDVEPFVEALRGDLPSRGDEERVRSRLLAAGILVTGAAATTSNAAASLGGSGLGSGAASPLAATASPFAAGPGAGTLATASGAGVSAAGAGASSAAASGAAASGAAAGVAGGLGAAGAPAALAKAGLLSKVLLMPMAAKLGVATTLAVAVASSVPLVVSQGDSAPSHHHTASPARAAEATPSESGDVSPPRASVPSGDSPVSPREVLQASDSARAPSPGATAAKRRQSFVSARRSAGTTLPEPQPAASGETSASTAKAAAFSGREHTANAASPERGRTERVRVSTLGEETRLIEQAMLALGDGDRDLAQRSLDEHARRFPRGLLMPERERARERLRQLDADRR